MDTPYRRWHQRRVTLDINQLFARAETAFREGRFAESRVDLLTVSRQIEHPAVFHLLGASNPRTHTLLIWLNDDYAGGETSFPAAELTVRGNRGDALLFANLRADGRPDEASIHAGLRVASGHKWLATRWIRLRPTTAFDGPG